MLEDEIGQVTVEESRGKDSRWLTEDRIGSCIAEEMRAAKCVRFQRAAGLRSEERNDSWLMVGKVDE